MSVPTDDPAVAFVARHAASAAEWPGAGRVLAIVESGLNEFSSGCCSEGNAATIEIPKLGRAGLDAIAPAARGMRPTEIGILVSPDTPAVSDDSWAETLDHLRGAFGDLGIPVAVFFDGATEGHDAR